MILLNNFLIGIVGYNNIIMENLSKIINKIFPDRNNKLSDLEFIEQSLIKLKMYEVADTRKRQMSTDYLSWHSKHTEDFYNNQGYN